MNGSLICIVGPPGAGKTTLTDALISRYGGSKFRLREAVRRNKTAGIAVTADPLGWVGDDVVGGILTVEFARGLFASGPFPVLLDNFPGNASQLEFLRVRSAAARMRLSMLELQAPDTTVTARITSRRICPRCGSDSHAPCAVAADAPESCRDCGGPVARRDTDSERQHSARLSRYRTNLGDIMTIVAGLGIPHRRVDASRTADQVLDAVSRVYLELTAETIAVSPM